MRVSKLSFILENCRNQLNCCGCINLTYLNIEPPALLSVLDGDMSDDNTKIFNVLPLYISEINFDVFNTVKYLNISFQVYKSFHDCLFSTVFNSAYINVKK